MRSLNKVKLLLEIDKVSKYLSWVSQQVQWSHWIIWMLWAKWVTMVPPFTPQRCCAWTGKPLFCLVYRSSWYCQPLLWCVQCNQLMQPFMSMHVTAHVSQIFLRGKGNSNGVLLSCMLTQCHTCAACWLEPWPSLCLSLDPLVRTCTQMTELEISWKHSD